MATITFTSALDTLQSMFPKVDQAIIRDMLEMNRGHMENTVAQLLQINPDESEEAAAAGTEGLASDRMRSASDDLSGSTEHKEPPMMRSVSAPSPSDPAANDFGYDSTESFRLWDPLPPNFLRPPMYFQAPNASQIASDEMIARYLQNRFSAESRQVGAYGRGHPQGWGWAYPSGIPGAAAAGGQQQQQQRPRSESDEESFGQKLDKFMKYFKGRDEKEEENKGVEMQQMQMGSLGRPS